MTTRRRVLKTGIGLAAAALLASVPVLSAQRLNIRLHAGAGRAQVMLTDLFPLGEFTGEHDPLYVRVLLLDNGQQRQVIAVIDLTSMTQNLIDRMKIIIQEIAGVPASHTVIVASHSFSTPHISDGLYGGKLSGDDIRLMAAFSDALRLATSKALTGLQPAKIGAGAGFSRVGVNRNAETPYGWWLGADDSGYSDPHTGILRIDGLDGRPLAVMINCAVQPAVMDASQSATGGRLVSADIAGASVTYVEKHYENETVAFYLTGAAGDQVPYLQASRHVVGSDGRTGRIDIHEAGFAVAQLIGQRLGSDVVRVTERIVMDDLASLSLLRKTVTLPTLDFSPRNAPAAPVRSFSYRPAGSAEMPVILLQWGDVALVGVQPELSAITGAHIRAASPYKHTFVITMADGAAKYMPDRQSYDRFTYEARSSSFARGAAETAAEFIISQLKSMKALQS